MPASNRRCWVVRRWAAKLAGGAAVSAVKEGPGHYDGPVHGSCGARAGALHYWCRTETRRLFPTLVNRGERAVVPFEGPHKSSPPPRDPHDSWARRAIAWLLGILALLALLSSLLQMLNWLLQDARPSPDDLRPRHLDDREGDDRLYQAAKRRLCTVGLSAPNDPNTISRKEVRARDKRERTVPIGTLRAEAAST
jgi:hypothetical protein